MRDSQVRKSRSRYRNWLEQAAESAFSESSRRTSNPRVGGSNPPGRNEEALLTRAFRLRNGDVAGGWATGRGYTSRERGASPRVDPWGRVGYSCGW